MRFIGGTKNDTLGRLRKVRFSEMSVKSKKGLQQECLPPTEGSAWQHSLRVYLQITQWKSLIESNIKPDEWGWQLKEDHQGPIMTNQVSQLRCYILCSGLPRKCLLMNVHVTCSLMSSSMLCWAFLMLTCLNITFC